MRDNLHGGVAQHTWHQEPEQRPAGGSSECENGAHGTRGREETRAQLPLTSSITLEERKRGPNGKAHQYTSRPRFRPKGLYG
jgi:hypothetical protein